MEIVVEQVLILTHAFNYRVVGYVLVFPLQLAFCIMVASLWCHLEHLEHGGAKRIITLWSEGHVLLKYGE